MKSLLLFYIILCIPVSIIAGPEEKLSGNNTRWRAGVARVVITPEEKMWMGAYASRNHPAEGTRHDLWAKALILEDAKGNRALMVSTDLTGIRKELSVRVRNRLNELYGLSYAQILLNSSHTHTAPETEYRMHNRLLYSLDESELDQIDRYAKRLEDQLVALVGKAIESMEPAEIFSGNGIARFQVNRRNNKESELLSTTELKGPNDFAVPVIKVSDKEGNLMAVVFGYACHGTVLDDYYWSGDYAGYAQLALEELFPGTTAMFFQGAGADLNPLPRRTPYRAMQYGKELAAAVERVLQEQMIPLIPFLQTAYSEIDLKFAHPSPTLDGLKEMLYPTSDLPVHLQHEARYLIAQLENGETLMESYPYPVQVWKLGHQTLVALGGELVVGYSIALKNILGENIFVLGYSNDVMGYIPTAIILEEGGYEANKSPLFSNPWSSDIEELIVKKVLHLEKSLSVAEEAI